MTDIRKARFYVCEGSASSDRDFKPVDFDTALQQSLQIARQGSEVHVMYTEDASQSQLTEFARLGIRAMLVPQG